MDTSPTSAQTAGPSTIPLPPTTYPSTSTTSAVTGHHTEGTNGDRDHETKDVLAEEQVIVDDKGDELYYRTFRSEAEDMDGIARLVDQELSEPYVLSTALSQPRWSQLIS